MVRCRSLSWSAIRFSAAMRPPAMVKPMTAIGSSRVPNRAPAWPFTSTGWARCANRGAVARTWRATGPAPAPDHSGQPAPQVADGALIAAVEPQPCFLHRVLGFADRAEHAVGDRLEVRTALLELPGKPVLLGHLSSPL